MYYSRTTALYFVDPEDIYCNAVTFQLLRNVAKAVISNHGATVDIKQTFQFDGPSKKTPSKCPVRYKFPIPPTGAITSFKATINGSRVIESECFPLEEGKEKYEKALKETDAPAAMALSVTPDTFEMFLGNMDPHCTVDVEIRYTSALEYDTQFSGYRFTLPTSMFPRYGTEPETQVAGHADISINSPKNGVFLSVEYAEGSDLTSYKCISHPTATVNGNRITYASEATYMELDFVTVASIKSTTSLYASCEPTINRSKLPSSKGVSALNNVLGITLNPRDLDEESTRPKEVIFILDRSGSMCSNVETLKDALRLFVTSLPASDNTVFNFISFGSDFSRMWSKSLPLTEESFNNAQKYIDSIDADMGGTEILAPLKSAVKLRRTDRKEDFETEIILLTDGEVSDLVSVQNFIQETVQKPKNMVRFFALGIGNFVSHALLDSIANEGKGYKQVVMNGESMEKKVIRLLKTALAARVQSVDVFWQQKEPVAGADGDFEMIAEPEKPLHFDLQKVARSTVHREASFMSTPDHGLLPIFSDWKSTMFIFYEKDSMLLPYVKVVVHLSDGKTAEFEAPIVKAKESQEPTYVTTEAAKQLLLNIERSNTVSAYDKKAVGEATGLYFQLMSPWTSMVAVEEEDSERKVMARATDSVDDPFDRSPPQYRTRSRGGPSLMSSLKSVLPGGGAKAKKASFFGGSAAMPPPPQQTGGLFRFSAASSVGGPPSGGGYGGPPVPAPMVSAPMPARSLRKPNAAISAEAAIAPLADMSRMAPGAFAPEPASMDFAEGGRSNGPYDILAGIVKHSKFDGSYDGTDALLALLFVPAFKLHFSELFAAVGDAKGAKASPGLLALAVWLFLNTELKDLHESWGRLAGKSLAFAERNVDKSEVAKYKALVTSYAPES